MKTIISSIFVGAVVSAAYCAEVNEVSPVANAVGATNATAAVSAPMPRPPFDRAKVEARMKERMAQRIARMVEVLKKYGLDDEKAKQCAEELMSAQRRPMPRPRKERPAAPQP